MKPLLLHCPHCGFHKSIAADTVPDRPVMARCPRCHKAFRFEKETAQFAFAGPVAAPPNSRPAGFWVRLLALMVDGAILLPLQGLMVSALVFCTALLTGEMDSGMRASLEVGTRLASLTVLILYMAGMTSLYGQTLGKRLFGLKVVRSHGGPIGFGCSLIRELPGKLISLLLLGYGFVIAAFRKEKMALHDSIADTRVIHI